MGINLGGHLLRKTKVKVPILFDREYFTVVDWSCIQSCKNRKLCGFKDLNS